MILVVVQSRYVLVIPTKRRMYTATMVVVLIHLYWYSMLVLVLVSLYIPGARYEVGRYQSCPSVGPFVRCSLYCTEVQERRVLLC